MRRPTPPIMLALALSALIFMPVGQALADRGSIPFDPGVEIFEPTQNAVIGFNGKEEVLILSTDLHASKATKILEVLPLPSEPAVTESDVAVFRTLTDIINARLAGPGRSKNGHDNGRAASEAQAPAAEVTFHETIGAHDITVFKVLNPDNFTAWVTEYLKHQGVDQVTIPEPLKNVVGEYLADGYGWFVFDVVSLGVSPQTNDAIQYRFATDELYYPMRITRTESGFTTVDLIVLSPEPLRKFPGIPTEQVNLRHPIITVNSDELAPVSQDLLELFGPGREIKLRLWRLEGELSGFEHDLLAR